MSGSVTPPMRPLYKTRSAPSLCSLMLDDTTTKAVPAESSSCRSPDPYQLFQICSERCHVLTVHVIKGDSITRGKIKDWLLKIIPGRNMDSGATGVYIVVQNEKETKNRNLPKKATVCLCVLEIVLCLVVVVDQCCIIKYKYDRDPTGGEGFVAGLFFLVTGGLGFYAVKKSTKSTITAFLIFNIFSAILSGALIIATSILMLSKHYHHKYMLRYRSGSYSYSGYDTYNDLYVADHTAVLVVYSCNVAAGLVQMVVSIVCSALCCRSCCCQGQTNHHKIVYLPKGQLNQPVLQNPENARIEQVDILDNDSVELGEINWQ